jgi:curved DNA-binding protein CbpA
MKWTPLSQQSGEAFLDEMRTKEPHELLGVSADASHAELTRAYRVLVARYHPDRLDPFLKGHADRLLRLINAAYDREKVRRGL